jgi:hypothetical protein
MADQGLMKFAMAYKELPRNLFRGIIVCLLGRKIESEEKNNLSSSKFLLQ